MRTARLLHFAPRARSLGLVAALTATLTLVGVVAGAYFEPPARQAATAVPAASTVAEPAAASRDGYFPDRFRLNAPPPEEHVQAF